MAAAAILDFQKFEILTVGFFPSFPVILLLLVVRSNGLMPEIFDLPETCRIAQWRRG